MLSNYKRNISEVVGRGHPDKIADRIAEQSLKEFRALGTTNRGAIEVLANRANIFVAGELLGNDVKEFIETPSLWISPIIKVIEDDVYEFECKESYFYQSPEIQAKVKRSNLICTGDQGVVYGYSTNETPEFLPISLVFAEELKAYIINSKWYSKYCHYEDYKILVEIEWSFLTKALVTLCIKKRCPKIENCLRENIYTRIRRLMKKYNLELANKMQLIFFTIGGLKADTGATNRKLMSDTYGCSIPHGGGGLNGKDLTKYDRLGVYFLRWVANHIIALGLCKYILLKCSSHIGNNKFGKIEIVDSSTISTTITYNWSIKEVIQYFENMSYNYVYKKFSKESYFCEGNHFIDSTKIWENLTEIKKIAEKVGFSKKMVNIKKVKQFNNLLNRVVPR